MQPPLGLLGLPLTFDGSSSTGTGLTYRLNFGDGTESTKPTDSHAAATPGRRTAQLTVTDALGRSDSTSLDYFVADMTCATTTCRGSWATKDMNTYFVDPIMGFGSVGDQVSGFWMEPGYVTPIIGSITSDLRFSARTAAPQTAPVTLEGTVQWNPSVQCTEVSVYCLTLEVKVTGGAWNGQTLSFRYIPDY